MTREQLDRIIQLCTDALATTVPLSAMVDSHLCIIREMAREAKARLERQQRDYR